MKGKKTGGRKAGAPNKVSNDAKSLAAEYAPAALEELARLSVEAENEQTRVSAGKEILDRAYGKAPQAIEQIITTPGEITNLEVARRVAYLLSNAVDNVTTH